MAKHAHLAAELQRPSCDALISDLVWFQWGYCRAYGPWHEYIYHVGDRLRWQPCADGRILAWAYFWDGRHEIGGNIGDPAVRHLIVKGGPEFYWEGPDQRWQDICGCPIQGAAIEIKDGIIARAWLYLPDELPGEANVYVVRDDGSLQPMPEWNDHPMEVVPLGC